MYQTRFSQRSFLTIQNNGPRGYENVISGYFTVNILFGGLISPIYECLFLKSRTLELEIRDLIAQEHMICQRQLFH